MLTRAILMPSLFQRLATKVLGNSSGSVEQLSAALGGVTIVQKGKEDKISDGTRPAVRIEPACLPGKATHPPASGINLRCAITMCCCCC